MCSIEVANLDKTEYADYVFAKAAISVESASTERLREAEHLLRSLELSSPFFQEHRNALLLNVIDTQRSGRSSTIIQGTRRAFAGIAAVARYLKGSPDSPWKVAALA
jgi:hypothetical protein